MTERAELTPTQPAHELSADRKPADAVVTPLESRKLPKVTLAFTSLLLITLAVAACRDGGENRETPDSTPNPQDIFGFTIPSEYKTSWEKALAYVREQEHQKRDELIDNDEVRISSIVISPEVEPPDIIVDIKGPSKASEAKDAKDEWAENLQSFFEPLDICEIDIGWGITTRPDVNPDSQDPFGDIGLDPNEFRITPGCQGKGEK